ncbi:hypothetical protein Bca101_069690 [Brassica carinata]
MGSPCPVSIPEASNNADDVVIPEMMFAPGEEPVGVRVLTYQSSRAISSILNVLEEDEVQKIRETTFGKLVEVAEKPGFSGRFASKKTVTDKEKRIKIACLALVSSVLLSTNLKMKISKEHVEAIEDFEEFLAFPWERLAFDMLMSSIKERDEISLSQKSISLKGFVLAIQLVMVEAVPALTEVVQEGSFSSDSESDDDNEEGKHKIGKKHNLSPGHGRVVDAKAEVSVHCELITVIDFISVEVRPIISQNLERPIPEESVVWADEEKDDKVDKLVQLISMGHVFNKTMFKGGETKASAERMREELKDKKKGKRSSKPINIPSSCEHGYIAEIVMEHMEPRVATLNEKLALVTSCLKDVSAKVGCIEDTVNRVIAPVLSTFKEELVRSVADIVNQKMAAVHWKETNPIHTRPDLEQTGDVNDGGDLNAPIIRNVLGNLTQYSTPTRSADKCQKSDNRTKTRDPPPAKLVAAREKLLDATSHPSLTPESNHEQRDMTAGDKSGDLSTHSPSFALGLTQEDQVGIGTLEGVHRVSIIDDIPKDSFDGGSADVEILRKSKRAKLHPSALVAGYQSGTEMRNRAMFDHIGFSANCDDILFLAKFTNLKQKLEKSLVRPLTSKVMDILVRLLRSNYEKRCSRTDAACTQFLDTRFISSLSRAYPRINPSSPYLRLVYIPFNFDKQHWVGLCVDWIEWKITVLDCNPIFRSDDALATDLMQVAVMLPYLLVNCGGATPNDIQTPLAIYRPDSLVNNFKVPNSGLTSVLLMQSHDIGGIDSCRAISPENIDREAQGAGVMLYEFHESF